MELKTEKKGNSILEKGKFEENKELDISEDRNTEKKEKAWWKFWNWKKKAG
jgi:hypothetical protein